MRSIPGSIQPNLRKAEKRLRAAHTKERKPNWSEQLRAWYEPCKVAEPEGSRSRGRFSGWKSQSLTYVFFQFCTVLVKAARQTNDKPFLLIKCYSFISPQTYKVVEISKSHLSAEHGTLEEHDFFYPKQSFSKKVFSFSSIFPTSRLK